MSELADPDLTPQEVRDAEAGASDLVVATRKQIRREQRRVVFRSPGFIIGVIIVGFWILSAIVPGLLTEWGPKEFVDTVPARSRPGDGTWFGTDQIGPSPSSASRFIVRNLTIEKWPPSNPTRVWR